MARAMPVISISRPRKTNSGTASSTRPLMPSSMRETTTVSGTRGDAHQEGERRDAEGEADRHAQQHAGRQQHDEEEDEVPVADAP